MELKAAEAAATVVVTAILPVAFDRLTTSNVEPALKPYQPKYLLD